MGCIVETLKKRKTNEQTRADTVQTNIRSKGQFPLHSMEKISRANDLEISKIIERSAEGVSHSSFRTINIISVGNSQNVIERRLNTSKMTSRQIFLQDYQRIKDEYEAKYKQLILHQGQVKLNAENTQILNSYLINLKMLAKVQNELGFHEQSLRNYKKYLQITKAMGFSKNSQEIVLAQKDVAWLEFKKGRKPNMWEMLESCPEKLGKEKESLAHAQILGCQGQIKFIQKEYSQALKLYERVYGIEKSLAPESPAVYSTLNRLGLVHYHLKDYQHAVSLYQASLGMAKRLKGENSMDYAKTLGNLGNIYFEQAQYAKARQVYCECLSICCDNNQTKSSLYTNSLSCAGNACYKQGDFQEALKYYKKLGVNQKQAKSKRLLQTLDKIAKCHQKLGNKPFYSTAKLEYYQQSMKTLQL